MRRLSSFLPALVLAISTHPARADAAEPAQTPAGVVPPAQSVPAPVTGEPQKAEVDCPECERSSTHSAPPIDAPKGRESSSPRSHWYGWQTLTVDGAALGLLAVSVASASDSVGPVALSGATYALGGPIVHLAHGRGGIAVVSLLMRVGLATAGTFAGAKLECSNPSASDFCGPAGAAAGLLVGAAVSITLDAALLAREEAKPERPLDSAALSLSPTVSVTRDSGVVGLAGAF